MGVCNCSMFCCTLLNVHSSFAIILTRKRETESCLSRILMSRDGCATLPRGAMGVSAIVIVVFSDHTHLLF